MFATQKAVLGPPDGAEPLSPPPRPRQSPASLPSPSAGSSKPELSSGEWSRPTQRCNLESKT